MYLQFHKGNLHIENFLEPKFTEIQKTESPEDRLLLVANILDRYYVKWWLSFGTCLGFFRDGDFIPEDSDIDFSIVASEDKIIEIIDELKDHFTYLRSVRSLGNQTQAAFVDKDGLIIDLSFFREDGDYLISEAEDKVWKDKGYLFDNLAMLKTKYGEFPVPYPTKDYLKARYGNWEVKSSNKSLG